MIVRIFPQGADRLAITSISPPLPTVSIVRIFMQLTDRITVTLLAATDALFIPERQAAAPGDLARRRAEDGDTHELHVWQRLEAAIRCVAAFR